LRGTGIVRPVVDFNTLVATTSYRTSYATGTVLPSLEADVGRLTAFAGVRLDGATISRESSAAPFGALPVSSTSSGATGQSVIAGARISTATSDGHPVMLGYRLEQGTIADLSQRDQSISASIDNSGVVLGGNVGWRTRAGSARSFGSGSLTFAVSPDVAVQFAGGRYPENPLLGVAAGSFVNAGLVMRFGTRATAGPQPAAVQAPARGMTRLAIRAVDAGRVEVAGDFNRWNPVETSRAPNGVWYVDLSIPPGEYRYAFRIDGRQWRVPEGVAAADDEFGGKSAWLTVKQTSGSPSSK
jgi:hypothetical protein